MRMNHSLQERIVDCENGGHKIKIDEKNRPIILQQLCATIIIIFHKSGFVRV